MVQICVDFCFVLQPKFHVIIVWHTLKKDIYTQQSMTDLPTIQTLKTLIWKSTTTHVLDVESIVGAYTTTFTHEVGFIVSVVSKMPDNLMQIIASQ